MKTYSFLPRKRVHGFTLTEILVVLVIVGILVLLALPNLLPTVTKAKATEAKLQLGLLRTLEQSYFYEHSQYSKDLSELGFKQEKLSTEDPNGHANYRIEITNATSTTFTGSATAVKDFNGDGKYDTWQIDQDGNLKQTTPN
jgi:type IV pilus assembly protein PilE